MTYPICEKHHAGTPEDLRIQALRSDIYNADNWTLAADAQGPLYRPMFINTRSDDNPCSPVEGYRIEDLCAIDSRLPGVFPSMLKHAAGKITGASIRNTMRLWKGELLPVPTGMLQDCTTAFYAVMDTYVVETAPLLDKKPRLIVRFLGVETAMTDSGVVHATLTKQPRMSLSMTWLDTHRPNWRNVVLLAESLQLTEKALAQLLLFTEKPVPVNISMPPDIAVPTL